MIGSGLAAWLQSHQATPLSTDEVYPWPNVKVSVLPILIANSAGVTVRTLVGWDEASGEVLQPGPGVVASPPTPAPAPLPTMYDSTTAADIPPTAQLVAGYVDGDFVWSDADRARFPKFITISVTGGQLADFWDCETGDLNAGLAAAVVQAYPGTGVYCNLSTAPQVVSAMHWAGMDGQYVLWIADWTGEPHMPSVSETVNGVLITPVVVACQYANPASSGGHYDLSVVTDEFMRRFV